MIKMLIALLVIGSGILYHSKKKPAKPTIKFAKNFQPSCEQLRQDDLDWINNHKRG